MRANADFETRASYSVRIRTTDSGRATLEKIFAIDVTDVNEAPNSLTLSQNSIVENKPPNTVIGMLTATDPDRGTVFIFSLVPGTGSDDNSSFTISGNQLIMIPSPDFETKSSYSIRVQAADQDGLSHQRALSISVTNVNEPPNTLAISNNTVPEKAAADNLVGTMSATDPDGGGSLVYSLVSGQGDNDNGQFSLFGNELRIASSADFETKSSYSIRVQAADQGGLTLERQMTIFISNVNEAPVTLNLSNATLAENGPQNALVGTFSTIDPDAGEAFSYTLVAGTGASDNGAFSISGNELRLAASADFESKPNYNLRVRATDAGGLFIENAFIVTITDLNDPPSDISLSATSLPENMGANALLATVSNVDADAGTTTSTFTLVDGVGSTDNGFLFMSGNQLL